MVGSGTCKALTKVEDQELVHASLTTTVHPGGHFWCCRSSPTTSTSKAKRLPRFSLTEMSRQSAATYLSLCFVTPRQSDSTHLPFVAYREACGTLVELHESPPVSTTTQIHPFKLRSRGGLYPHIPARAYILFNDLLVLGLVSGLWTYEEQGLLTTTRFVA
ncbi:hypothetical protein JOM56_013670 [Amanita muscaria]